MMTKEERSTHHRLLDENSRLKIALQYLLDAPDRKEPWKAKIQLRERSHLRTVLGNDLYEEVDR